MIGQEPLDFLFLVHAIQKGHLPMLTVTRAGCDPVFAKSVQNQRRMSDKLDRKPKIPVLLAAILSITCLSFSGSLADEISDAPGKPSFRTPPLPDLQATRAFDNYLSRAPFPDQPHSTAIGKELRLTMVDAIGLALDGNLGIKSAYLGRISDRTSLAMAEDKFNPVIGLQGSIKTEGGETSTTTLSRNIDGSPQTVKFDDIHTRDDKVTWHTSIGPAVTWLLPTGANVQLDLQLEADDSTEKESGTSSSAETDYGYGGSVGFSVTQPLLKGAGLEVNEASIRIAHLNDRQNILSLSSTVENTVSQAILDYRAVIQAKAEVNIAEQALASARRNLASNKAQVEEGRLPKAGLVQYETQIRQHQISLKRANTALENSRRELAKTLGQSLDSKIDTVEFDPEIDEIKIGFDQALAIAHANRSDYEAAQLAKESARFALLFAKNDLLWDLTLVAGVHSNIGDTRSHIDSVASGITRSNTRDEQLGWNIGLNIVIPLDDNDQAKRALTVARIASLQADVMLEDTRQNVMLTVRNAITSLNSAWEQMELSEQARQLAKQQYQIAQEELEYGRTTNFEVISLDNAFQESKVQKLDAQINYLNAVTALDLALGTTLKTWNIDIGEPGS